MLGERVAARFRERYGEAPALLVRAPGRVNLIGEHTDYNDGFVFPMAIDRAVWLALRPRPGDEVEVYSLEYEEGRTFSLAKVRCRETGYENAGWIEYIKGVAWSLGAAGHGLRAWEGVMAGDVPIGAGLSSSAALEMATARAFAALGDLPWEPGAMARLGQRAENQWVGVNCGIMDQMISAAGRAGHALLLDCRSLEYELVPLPAGTAVVVLDTGTRRGLVDSAYNERRRQCEAAAAHFGVKALRDVSGPELAARAGELDETTRRRARHVVSENERTLEAAQAMRAGDGRRLGALMDRSHESLRLDFEVSSEALDIMVTCARERDGCLGARMTGAGFGGCAVALVEAGRAAAFAAATAAAYRVRAGHEPAAYVCAATDGASVVG
ncbi:MAG: galactokinase [Gemmatimonadota bacterium]